MKLCDACKEDGYDITMNVTDVYIAGVPNGDCALCVPVKTELLVEYRCPVCRKTAEVERK
jgi:hypothetical protein